MANKLITTTYLNKILEKLHDWMPFKKNNGGIVQSESNGETTLQTVNNGEIALGRYNVTDSNTLFTIGIGDENQRKNAIRISKNGEIFIITNIKGQPESLQHLLDIKGVTICENYEEILPYISNEYNGKMFYLTQESQYNDSIYDEGLYVVTYSSGGTKLIRIADAIKKELSNYYTKEEVERLITDISMGDLSGIYYTKTEIDNIISPLNRRISKNEEFIKNNISVYELEEITKTDINSDGIIG